MGGGHGLAATLTAVRRYTDQVTAVVSVADDGGSSGRLRELLGVMPPGDLRKCMVALAEPDSILAIAFARRFTEEELAGHSLGNLVLAGLIDAADDPIAGIDEACRLLGVIGRILPATTDPVVLKADADSGQVAGQVAVMATEGSDTSRWCPRTRRPRRRRWRRYWPPTRSSSGPDPCSPAPWPRRPCLASAMPSGTPRR